MNPQHHFVSNVFEITVANTEAAQRVPEVANLLRKDDGKI
jgi:hypothetical protein